MNKQTEPTLKEKKKLVPKGKKLNALKVKYKAEKILGAGFQKKLAKELKCSGALISLAFKDDAPYTLFRINKYLKGFN